jgi:hypothetical protein
MGHKIADSSKAGLQIAEGGHFQHDLSAQTRFVDSPSPVIHHKYSELTPDCAHSRLRMYQIIAPIKYIVSTNMMLLVTPKLQMYSVYHQSLTA